ncbi:hypothetical protein ATO7_15997 [Oceanococcus atlanticus]|uniref:Uncharacterized protein n=1 Tax=Oceanococcus atlanticus TaxID=1317117 RepID=A0A1Y1SB90_9GAMM|nr:DUF6776 family protein [Oceanococcus atlanticus]ORE85301.1 hypothetical protein ATO7_15997 [Oceanococcus atlanticus]RZO84042.1 MAG: hypothetical protein EVA65_12975 [Oceanococcus sp.]
MTVSSPGRRARLLRYATVALAGAVAGGLLTYGVMPESFDDAVPEELVGADCPAQLSALQRQRRQLSEELAYVKQSVIVEQEACFELRDSLSEQVAEVGKLNEQLAFYRGIVAPEQNLAGVRIHKAEIMPLYGRDYQFRLTLLQPVRQSSDAKGMLKLHLEGLKKDVMLALPLRDIALGEKTPALYEFRYYVEVFGQFRLPSDYRPLRLVAEAIPEERGLKPVSQTFVWAEILKPEAAEESNP